MARYSQGIVIGHPCSAQVLLRDHNATAASAGHYTGFGSAQYRARLHRTCPFLAKFLQPKLALALSQAKYPVVRSFAFRTTTCDCCPLFVVLDNHGQRTTVCVYRAYFDVGLCITGQDGIRRSRPYLVCCLGELNDVELEATSVDASILKKDPWIKVRSLAMLLCPLEEG